MAGPIGIAAGAAGVLTYKLYDAYRESNSLKDVSTDVAEKMIKQHESNIELIDSLDGLRNKSKLTNDEFVKYLDLQTRLENESNADAIALIKDEMNILQEKSGLSNDELQQMVDLNNEVTQTIPESTKEITEQGNRVADTTNKLRDYNDELRGLAIRELEEKLQNSLSNEQLLRKQIKDEQVELNRLVTNEEKMREVVRDLANQTIDSKIEQLKLEEERLNSAIINDGLQGDALNKANEELELTRVIISMLEEGEGTLRESLAHQIKTVDEQRELINGKKEQLEQTELIAQKLADQFLAEVNITAEKGRGIQAINEEIKRVEDLKKKLDDKFAGQQKNSEAYREQNDDLNTQLQRLEDAKEKVNSINELAGKTVYGKEIYLEARPTLDKFESMVGRSIGKRVNLHASGPAVAPLYAKGTPQSGHPGGPAIVGDGGGRELIQTPRGVTFLSPSTDTLIPDLPKGSHVIPHRETVRMLKSAPKYARGTKDWKNLVDHRRFKNNEFMTLLAINAKNNETMVEIPTQSSNRNNNDRSKELLEATLEQNELLRLILAKDNNTYIDGRSLGGDLEPIISEIQQRKKRVRDQFA
ncbi:hypothetical protein [Lentibacillus saliphilus]|uniref:hypothetical protein n=1 Tax=Lentibacillus saliphilus TaxID=2737028 RepID=UPI001C3079B6|nr:hypothetical protein [Lentibacillus saliphilus]